MTEPLALADKRLMFIAALVAAASIVYVVLNYTAAFPEASIDLRLSKAEISRQAQGFLRGRSLATAGFRQLTLFDPDDEARIYLERELGLAEANRLTQGEVAVWRWRARWFRPPDKEEMVVRLSPGGKLVGFEHIIAESAPGARLTRDAALRLATDFLVQQTTDPQRLIEQRLEERPARWDHVFTWEREGFRAKDATYRRTIVVRGDRVGQYSEYLYVPEQWRREFATLRSSNELYSQAAEVLYVLLGLAAVGVLIRSIRRREIRWRPLILIAGVVGALMVVSEWNAIPFYIDSMPTSSPYGQSLLYGLLLGLGSGTGVFFYVIVAAAAGEPLYRASQPARLALTRLPTLRAIRTREFFRATITGYGFAAFHLAFVVAFYLVGRRFGVWSPQDVNYSDFLSTRLPWVYPLTISLMAATSEEFWFRLLAIPLLKRYLRSTWLAVIIPAFLWGFLHANYPQQPGYIRGLEVGLIGVAAGFLMLRFGILATLVWHYTVDAVLIGMFLFHGGSWYFLLSGCLVGGAVLFPLAVSLIFYKRQGGFLVDRSLLNSEQDAAEPSQAVTTEPETPPVSAAPAPRWDVMWLYGAAALAVACVLLLPNAGEYGDFVRVRISRPAAEGVAVRELRARGVDPASWRRVTVFRTELSVEDFEYLRRVAGREASNDAVRERSTTGLWLVRFLKPMQKEEWRAWVDQQGRVAGVDHILEEKAPGARLTESEARALAEESLGDASGLKLVDHSSDRKDGRTDHHFVWEDPAFQMGDAKARISLVVQGDEVSGLRRFLKLPEDWLREFRRPRLSAILLPGVLGAAGLLLLVLFLNRLTAGPRFHWRVYVLGATIAAAAAAAAAINRWPLALASYDTATPLDRYLSGFVMGRVVVIFLAAFGALFAAMAADVFLQWAGSAGWLRKPSLVRLLALCGLGWGLVRIQGSVAAMPPGPRLSLPLWDLPGADTWWPGVTLVAQGFVNALGVLCLAAVAVCAAARLLKPRRRYALVALAAVLVAAARAENLPQFAWYFAGVLLAAGVLVLVVRTCGADLWTFGIALFWLLTMDPAVTLIRQPDSMLRWNGIGAAGAALLLGAVALWKARQAQP